jgi:hypothetical protein
MVLGVLVGVTPIPLPGETIRRRSTAGCPHPRHKLRAIQFNVGIGRLPEDLFGEHQTVLIAHCHYDVTPLQSRIATHDVTRFPVLDAADH